MICASTGKLTYRTEAAALKALRHLLQRRRGRGSSFGARARAEAYRCKDCHAWHLGHTARAEVRR